MSTPIISPERAAQALSMPREQGLRSVIVDGEMISVVALRRIAESVRSAPTPVIKRSVMDRPDSEKVEAEIIDHHSRFEANSQPIKAPQFSKQDGDHMKSYLINYIDRKGVFHCEKMAAKGIVTAISLFYMQFSEKAIVSVICVL